MSHSTCFVYTAPLSRVNARLRLTESPEQYAPHPVESLRASVKLLVHRPNRPHPATLDFRIDSGSGTPSMSLDLAEMLGIQTIGPRGQISVTTGAGACWEWVRVGRICVQFPDLGREFHWTCHFHEKRPWTVPPMLGLHNVLDSLKLSFDRTRTPDAPYGSVVFQEYV